MKSRLIKNHTVHASTVILFTSLAIIWIVAPYSETGGRHRKGLVETKANAGVTEKRFAGIAGERFGRPLACWNYYSTFTYEVRGRRYETKRSGHFYGDVYIYYNPKNPSYFVLSNSSPVKPILLRGFVCLVLSCVIHLLVVREDKRKANDELEQKQKRGRKRKTAHPLGSSGQYPWSRKI